MCQSTSSKLTSVDKLLVTSVQWLVEAKVKILMLVQSAMCPHSDSMPLLKDSPDMPLELAVASVRNIAGVIRYAVDPTARQGDICLFFHRARCLPYRSLLLFVSRLSLLRRCLIINNNANEGNRRSSGYGKITVHVLICCHLLICGTWCFWC